MRGGGASTTKERSSSESMARERAGEGVAIAALPSYFTLRIITREVGAVAPVV
jgi:hypothetical protein